MTIDDETVLLLNAHQDGELSPGEALDMQRRLAGSPELQAVADRLGGLSGMVRETIADMPASTELRARIIQQIGFADAPPRHTWSSWRSLAATLLVGVIGGGLIGSSTVYLGMSPGASAVGEAVLAGHLRGLVASQPFDIASSDRHVVKPWFNGRTTIAPNAPDLAEKGFPLAGGRIDVVGGKAVPTLVYRHDRHVISVTIVPKSNGASPSEEHHDGSTLERWDAGDLTYWAVSDLNVRDLRSFVGLFRTRIAGDG